MPPRRVKSDGRVWKVCPSCGEDKPHDETAYYRAGKHRDRSPKFYTRCKACCERDAKRERTDRSETAKERQKRRMRARQRAWVRLGQRYPLELRNLYEEELAKEYVKHGPMPKIDR